MNMVHRKFPEDSERFYRIQNRQQLLARDILRDKYGITIPEPQLTGTSVRQESSQEKSGLRNARHYAFNNPISNERRKNPRHDRFG